MAARIVRGVAGVETAGLHTGASDDDWIAGHARNCRRGRVALPWNRRRGSRCGCSRPMGRLASLASSRSICARAIRAGNGAVSQLVGASAPDDARCDVSAHDTGHRPRSRVARLLAVLRPPRSTFCAAPAVKHPACSTPGCQTSSSSASSARSMMKRKRAPGSFPINSLITRSVTI
jgi:hypothetical protein